ncbi:MAG: SPOR domain-containing protein [Pseudomonadales bacterium]|jgi:DedD protein
MDEQTRYRVTGSLFLLAVAIIVFPMLFDGKGLATIEIEPLDVPKTAPEVTRREDVAPETDLVARAQQLAAEVDDEGFQADAAGTRFGEPVLSEPDDATRVWAVQLASFSDEDNALKLRDRVRGDGFEAFISTAKQDGRVLNRVAVGPLLDRQEADHLRDELSDALSLDARIVAFSN